MLDLVKAINATILPGMTEQTFKTGSRGYRAFGKVPFNGKNYQVNILCVEIGSKPDTKVPARTK